MNVVRRSKDQSMIVGDNLMLTVAEITADRALLILSRKAGDRITFWEESSRLWITDRGTTPLLAGVSVSVWITGKHVRLGFEAPREMKIHRKEVYDLIHPHG